MLKGPCITYIKLCGGCISFFLFISAHTGAASSTDLGYSYLQTLSPGFFTFPCGHYHSGVRHRYSKYCNDLFENIIRHTILKIFHIDVISRAYPRDTDGMGPASPGIFQMFCVHQKSYKIIFVIIKPEQDSASHIIYPAFIGSVHGFSMIIIIAFWAGRVEL